MNDDLTYFLKDIKGEHPLSREAFVKFVLNGGVLDDEELLKKVSQKDLDYINDIYSYISLTRDIIKGV